MLISRRVALTAAGAVALAGCASSPVVNGDPAIAPSPPATPDPPVPTQAPEAASAQAALAALDAELRRAAGLDAWKKKDWARAAAEQCAAHLALLSLPDPLSTGEQEAFAAPEPVVGTATDEDAVAKDLKARAKRATMALDAAAAAAASPELRLTWASAATAANGLAGKRIAPVPGDAAPGRFAAPTREAALGVAISHAWALIFGLGVGLGRLGSKDPLHEWGLARLNAVKELRNELRAALGPDTPTQPTAFELPTAMDSAKTIKAGWATLERSLLEGYATAVAGDDAPRWRELMRAQAKPVAELGAPLPFWPGWVT
ncbi:MAG TPA: hypothetical protein PKE42_08040 [Arachnia sp.]|nr:hypothetical protein [Arachnia sp.]